MADNKIAVADIIATVARYTGIRQADILGPCRQREFVQARHLAMWLVCNLRPGLSYPQIGRAFNRHHTSIMFAVRKYGEHLSGRDPVAVWRDVCDRESGRAA